MGTTKEVIQIWKHINNGFWNNQNFFRYQKSKNDISVKKFHSLRSQLYIYII